MKNKIVTLLIGLMCLCGCNKDNSSIENSSSSFYSNIISESSNEVDSSSSDSSSSKESSSNSSESSSSSDTMPKYDLEIPSLVLNEETGVVSWEPIEGAKAYNYIINDQNIKSTTGTTIELEDKSNVSVQAVGDNNESKWSLATTYYDTSDVVLEGDGEYYNVYFHDANVPSQQVKSASKVNKPTDPIKENYLFDNWYEDPFYNTVFDFNKPIYENTIIYAHYTPTNLVDDVYYWVKANDKISSIDQGLVRDSGWRFIPLKEVENSSPKVFTTIVSVNNSSSTDPAYFLVMDGFDDNSSSKQGRTYYKNGNSDFSIVGDGTYKITFSVETQYKLGSNNVHVKWENYTSPSYANSYVIEKLDTPIVEVDSENNLAYISEVEGADSYEVIINNEPPTIINTNTVTLNARSHISVRAIKNSQIYSNWSIPKANIKYVYEDVNEPPTFAYVYFYETNQNAKKVEINTYVEEITPSKEGYKFLGWYLDLAKTKKAEFPYLVTSNTVFYPKWEISNDVYTKEYYNLVDSANNKVKGLTWNIDNYTFYEYETGEVYLAFGENYYVQTLDGNKKWGPYTVSDSGNYKIYFSEEHYWNVNTDKQSNVYIAKSVSTIYFSNAKRWTDTIYAYLWSSTSNDILKSWPGTEMTYLEINNYGEEVYTIEFDSSKYDMIIFSHGSNGTIHSQTVNISLKENTRNGFYVTSKNSEGKYQYGTYSR